MTFEPNTTPTPNWLYNGEMKKMNGTELKVVMLITRKTLGWFDPMTGNQRKEQDYISQSQFIQFTGQSNRSIATAIQRAIKMGWIIAKDKEGSLCDTPEKRARRKVWYQLGNVFIDKISGEESSLDKEKDQNLVKNFPKSGEENDTNLVKKVHSTKETITKETITKDDLFDQFWKEYPKKVGKVVAEKSFKKLKASDSLLKEILNGLSNYKETEQWQKDNGKYIPNPATFLNQRRWEDSLETDQGDIIIPEYAKNYNK